MKKAIIEYLDERGIDLKTSFGEELIILNKTDFNEFAEELVKKLNIHNVSGTLNGEDVHTFKLWLFAEGYTQQGNYYIKNRIKYYESKLIEEYNELVMNI